MVRRTPLIALLLALATIGSASAQDGITGLASIIDC
jgi:hypothetical protein